MSLLIGTGRGLAGYSMKRQAELGTLGLTEDCSIS